MIRRRPRLPYAWILFLAFVPSISFAGHWDVQVAVPGAGVTIGFSPSHAHVSPGGAEPLSQHRDHCHVDASGCSDQPLVSTAQVGHLGELIALGAPFDAAQDARPSGQVRPEGVVMSPDIPPPRTS
ncbi:MAG: hypothetical protein AB7T37_07350 [Dehalococcoidia bacterium]